MFVLFGYPCDTHASASKIGPLQAQAGYILWLIGLRLQTGGHLISAHHSAMILVRIGEQRVHHATHIPCTLRKVRVQAKYGGNGVNDDQSNAVLLQQLGQTIVNAIK